MSVKVKCVHCGERVDEFTALCPKCCKPVANKDAPTNVPESPWKWSTTASGKKKVNPLLIGAIAIAAAVILFLIIKM